MGNKGYALLDDNGNLVGQTPYYGEFTLSGGSEFTIDGVNQWHMLSNFAASDFSGVTIDTGKTGAITVFADAGGGKVTVTSVAHGLSENDFLSITGTTSYNDLFGITNVTTDTFDITDTFVANDATGTFHHSTHLDIPVAGDGEYTYTWCANLTSAGNNKIYEVTTVLDGVTNGIARRLIAVGSDVGQMACAGLVAVSGGKEMGLAIRNITDATNFTMEDAAFTAFRIGT